MMTMTMMTMLQQGKLAKPAAVTTGDFWTAFDTVRLTAASMFNSGMQALTTVVPILTQVCYLAVIVVLLWQVWRARGFNGWSRLEMIGLAIAFGLMR